MTIDTSPTAIRAWAMEEAARMSSLADAEPHSAVVIKWRYDRAALFRAVAALAEREASRPSPSAKRVEAWCWREPGQRHMLYYKRPCDGAIYLTTFPGVHDAASAEAFERAVRGCMRALRVLLEIHLRGETPTDTQVEFAQRDADALAPYLPKTPR